MTREEHVFTIELSPPKNGVGRFSSTWRPWHPESWRWRDCLWSERLTTTIESQKVTVYVLSRTSLRFSRYELQALARDFLNPLTTRWYCYTQDDLEREKRNETVFYTIPYDFIEIR